MNRDISIVLHDIPFFDELADAIKDAASNGGCVYTMITEGRKNWLESGVHKVNCAGFAVLPFNMADSIDMEDDWCASVPSIEVGYNKTEYFCCEACYKARRKYWESEGVDLLKFATSRLWDPGTQCSTCGAELDDIEVDVDARLF